MRFRVIVFVLCAFLVLWLGLAAVGAAPSDAWQALFQGSLGSKRALSGTLKEMTPLLLAGLAVFVALKAGLFNIGVEGQFLVGACAAAAVALAIPNGFGMVLAVLASLVAGALWAWPAAAIKVYRGGHEVISTIMLNNLALLLTAVMVRGPLQSKTTESPTTASIADSARVPFLVENGSGRELLRINAAWFFGFVLLAAFAFWLKSTVGGYELRAVGANAKAAAFAGIDAGRLRLRSMLVSGGIAGLAGAFQVLAYEGRFYPNFSPGYGFDGLGVALLAGASPWGLIPASFVFGVLAQGNIQLSIEGIPRGIGGVLLGLLILSFAVVRYREVRARG